MADEGATTCAGATSASDHGAAGGFAGYGDAEDGAVDDAVRLLLRVAGETMTFFRATAAGHDLTPVEAQVIYLLDGRTDSLVSLARRAGLHKANLTAVLDRLQDRGLIVRAAVPEDRRVRRPGLTAAGADLARHLTAALHHGAPIRRRLTGTELHALADLLRRAAPPDV